jgi:dephospho-CoA kinase
VNARTEGPAGSPPRTSEGPEPERHEARQRRAPGRPLLIGLTGPIACGKSAIASWMAARGAVIVDADVLAREVVRPGEPALGAIVETWGAGILGPDGSLDRTALGRLVFADAAQLRRLEAIVHPAVRPRIQAAIDAAAAGGAQVVVLEAIRLVDGGYADACDEVWLVVCDPASQRRRLIDRGTPPADADQRIAAQAGLIERLRPAATRIIDTTGEPAETRSRVEAALAAALAAAGPDASPAGPDTGP